MTGSIDDEALQRARIEIADLSDAFRAAAAPALERTLGRRVEALIEARRTWWDALTEDVRAAFRSATARAIDGGVERSLRRLEAEDVWLSPLVAPGVDPGAEVGWAPDLPEWLAGVLRRLAPKRDPGSRLEALDDPGNRIWLALVAAARPLDPVMEEFGLAPADAPSLGGGHYGLAPKTTEQLDPSGELGRLWERYRIAHRRYAALAAERRA